VQLSAAATGAQARVANAVAEPSVQAVPVKPLPAADAAVSFYEHLSVAQQQLAQGQLRESLPTFERALALRAHSVDALLGKATAQFGLKEYDAAKSSAQLAVAIDPRSNEAFVLIAGSLEQLGQRAQAKAIYERCVDDAVDATICRERLGRLTASE
jgi:tetratricopeptide (TPR) repeat protein